jgi:hypothetical protein
MYVALESNKRRFINRKNNVRAWDLLRMTNETKRENYTGKRQSNNVANEKVAGNLAACGQRELPPQRSPDRPYLVTSKAI